MNINFPEIALGSSITGDMSGAEFGQLAELTKALTAGYGTDVSALTGGAALRIQSLDRTMMTTIQENKHFALFNALAKSNAGATVDEWTEQSNVGGFLGGSTNTETGTISESTGSYARRVGLVKYLMTKRQVSFVSTLGNNLASSEAVEHANGALQLLTDAEYLSFEGDSAVVATEFDGIYAQMVAGVAAGQVDSSNILDARAQSLSSVTMVNAAAAQVSAYGNFGRPTDIFLSQQTQADFDTALSPAYRVSLAGTGQDIMEGAPVVGIRTSWGNIANNPDVFIRDELNQKLFELLPGPYAAIATANVGLQPTLTAYAAASDTASMFGAAQAGNYYYAVTGINANGQSTAVISTQQAIAAGQKLTITITRSAGAQETGYVIYRGRLNGTNATSDFRQVARIPIAGATTPFVDYNRDIPGTVKAYILNLTKGAQAIAWRQLLPMLKFPLYPTASAVIPWAQLLFGYLRMTKRRHVAVIKNILPAGAVWRPFN